MSREYKSSEIINDLYLVTNMVTRLNKEIDKNLIGKSEETKLQLSICDSVNVRIKNLIERMEYNEEYEIQKLTKEEKLVILNNIIDKLAPIANIGNFYETYKNIIDIAEGNVNNETEEKKTNKKRKRET